MQNRKKCPLAVNGIMVSEEYSCRQHTIWQIALIMRARQSNLPPKKKLLDGLYMEKVMMVENPVNYS